MRNRSNHWLFLAICAPLAIALVLPAALAQETSKRTEKEKTAYRQAMEDADQKIAAEEQSHSELMKNLEYLTTKIGPRLTGSPQMNEASQWTLERFRAYGIDAHLETTEIPHAWYRGADSAEITSPIHRRIALRSAGWTKSTSGEVAGKVIYLNLQDAAELESMKGRFKNAIVLLRLTDRPVAPATAPDNAYDAVIPQPKGVPKRGDQSMGALAKRLQKLMDALAADGATALLLDSAKPDGLFNMSSLRTRFEPSKISSAFIAHEDFELLQRLTETGDTEMKISLNGKFSPSPVPVSITVAEIKGSEKPDERVIVGGHLDSWDLGQGALDNGTGAMAVLEAARTLKALGWTPKRTITFILFTGEEEAGTGADLFIKNHAAEIPKVDGVLIHDTGTGKVFSIALEGLYETGPLMEEIYKPLEEVFDLDSMSTRTFGQSDHVEFLQAGVPAYFCVQKPAGYGPAHHSQGDTFDKVIPDEINEGAALLAAWAWNVSEMPAALPHHAANKDNDPH
jgi:hypothetical protein